MAKSKKKNITKCNSKKDNCPDGVCPIDKNKNKKKDSNKQKIQKCQESVVTLASSIRSNKTFFEKIVSFFYPPKNIE